MYLEQSKVDEILAQHQSGQCLQASQLRALLAGAGVTFANLGWVTPVAVAAAHRDHLVQKVTACRAMLFGDALASREVYRRRVLRTAQALGQEVTEFEPESAFYQHDDTCYSLVSRGEQQYVYLHPQGARSQYVIDGAVATRQAVADLLTPSARKLLLEPQSVITNQRTGIQHSAHVRVVKLQNVVAVRARRQLWVR